MHKHRWTDKEEEWRRRVGRMSDGEEGKGVA